ncbi:helix-turn-helix domain-containing protein [Streptomyces sp. WAC05950]|uniref:helix-turn-helix domain-containing protein n=1 Tax=Streptomyces sp. WAC05950 TaxID=2487419 RepID=UPI000F7396CE|nr:helix-turn-helix domain-containing protein [Streptomyces sp. WAC05950]RST04994.1 DNA-binding protein [Streptomyces sp. WAC05950]
MKRDPLPHLYYPADVASALGKSEWWVKEQARNGRIPYTKPGRAYRFTAEQFAEIISLFAEGPSAPRVARQVRPAEVRMQGPLKPLRPAPSTRLRARPPRRTVQQDQQQTAA